MNMRPAACMGQNPVWAEVASAIFMELLIIGFIVGMAHYGHWNWAWMTLGLVGVGRLGDIRYHLKKMS